MPSRPRVALTGLFRVTFVIVLGTLVLSGCDDAADLAPEDQQIAIGASPQAACPSPPSPAGGEGIAESTIVATVFGRDGAVQEGLEVRLSASRGLLEETTLTTSASGQADTVLRAGRQEDTPVVVTATTSGGTTDEVELSIPPKPAVVIAADPTDPLIGTRTLSVGFQLVNPCNVAEVRYTLSYDPEILELSTSLSSGRPLVVETGALNSVGASGAPIPTVLDVSESAATGSLRIAYRRDDRPRTGLTGGGTWNLVTMVFDVLAPGSAQFSLDRVQVIPVGGRPYTIDPDRIEVVEVEGIDPDSGDQ